MKELVVNTVLFTKDGRMYGNAIIVYIDELTHVYFVKTDYGNEMLMSESEIRFSFYIDRETDKFQGAEEYLKEWRLTHKNAVK